MATILSISEIIELGRVSTYLSANYTSKQAMFGGSVIKPTPPVQIAWVTDALRFGRDGAAQTDASLRSTANYLYWLCGVFQLQAQNIISGPGGGSVTPTPSGGALPYPLDFIVSASSFIATDATSITISQFIGYNIEFIRGNLVQNTTPPPDGFSTYYSWVRATGLFTLLSDVSPFGAAQAGEQFRIMPTR